MCYCAAVARGARYAAWQMGLSIYPAAHHWHDAGRHGSNWAIQQGMQTTVYARQRLGGRSRRARPAAGFGLDVGGEPDGLLLAALIGLSGKTPCWLWWALAFATPAMLLFGVTSGTGGSLYRSVLKNKPNWPQAHTSQAQAAIK